MTDPHIPSISTFIARWTASGAAERANYQLFLSELCDALDLPRPDPTVDDETHNAYVFEKTVPLPHGTAGRIDLYRRGGFVLEAKQGSDRLDAPPALSQQVEQQRRQRKRGTAIRGTSAWDTAMERARQQAQNYARTLPANEVRDGRPPFLLVVDVGQSIALYSEFSRSGGAYIPFPDPASYRLALTDLLDDEKRELLRAVWLDPMSLDPSRRSARVTRDIADRLARLARSLEGAHPAEDVAHFLMRCLFTMFAEDVGLLPNRAFTQLLADSRLNVASFPPLVEELWRTMAHGGFSVALRLVVPHFDGGLFEDATALPLSVDQLQLLIEAAQADWRDVEPAIFGTLLVRALDPAERHKLGAHFTPRAYVERLVLPTIVEPLRAEWDAVKADAVLSADQGKAAEALTQVEAFQRRLASVRILDPACGSGNFLYVTLEHLKRLEGEVLEVRRHLGEGQMLLEMEGSMVRPEQFHGIEVNPWAAAIAELVLWIGFLQWHRRTRGDVRPPEPILRNLHNIECRDAVLAWDVVEPLLDASCQVVTRWDGRTTKPHPVTGLEVPDETARVPAWRYVNPRPAKWPEADFVVGNPPFIGNKRMRLGLGDGYVDALRMTFGNEVPDSADYVMYWWHKAAVLVRAGRLQRYGLITTNSLTQTFNRQVVQEHLNGTPPMSVVFAIPDHPWVDSADGAAVRIAMTVGESGKLPGRLLEVSSESKTDDLERDIEFRVHQGSIFADLTVGVDVGRCAVLTANFGLSAQGVTPLGTGFRLEPIDLEALGYDEDHLPPVIRPYAIGRDLVQVPERRFIIDFYGYSSEEARNKYPSLFQVVADTVKPERDAKAGRSKDADQYAKEWWLFAKTRSSFRPALRGLARYIGTCRTAKHRIFTVISSDTLPDAKIVAIALEDSFFLGVLSSRIHVTWAIRTGGWLGVGNDSNYNHSDCFGKFPFPAATEAQQERIRAIADEVDAHRKRQQAQHPKLTLTDMYNVLEKLRSGEALTAKERQVHEQGLVSVLKQLHDELDLAVFDAYGWPSTLADEEILERLVSLNAERAAEEAQGIIRWLRPDYQSPSGLRVTSYELPATQPALLHETVDEDTSYLTTPTRLPWPARMTEQAQAIRTVLVALDEPATAEQVAARFDEAPVERVAELLETLVDFGQARQLGEGWLMAA